MEAPASIAGCTLDSDLVDMNITLNNVVGTFSLGSTIDLTMLVMAGINFEKRGGRAYAQGRLRNPDAMANFWSSGKVVVLGVKSESQAKLAARKFARIVQKLAKLHPKVLGHLKAGSEVICVKNFKIVNVWASCNLPFQLKLNKFCKAYREASYEPEICPAVIYQLGEPKATLRLLATGSVTIQAPKVPNVHSAIRYIYPLLFPYSKPLKEVQKSKCSTKDDKLWHQ